MPQARARHLDLRDHSGRWCDSGKPWPSCRSVHSKSRTKGRARNQEVESYPETPVPDARAARREGNSAGKRLRSPPLAAGSRSLGTPNANRLSSNDDDSGSPTTASTVISGGYWPARPRPCRRPRSSCGQCSGPKPATCCRRWAARSCSTSPATSCRRRTAPVSQPCHPYAPPPPVAFCSRYSARAASSTSI